MTHPELDLMMSSDTSVNIVAKTKRWNLGIRTNPSKAFGLSPNSYFTDGVNNEEENDLWRQEHKHCFVWQQNGPFKVRLYRLIVLFTV